MINLADLTLLAYELRHQDNAMTAHPIFVVYEKIRQYGMQAESSDGAAWMNRYDCEDIVEDSEDKDDQEMQKEGYEYTYFIIRNEFVNAHFTRKSAEKYIADNQHRHTGKLFVYVESMYRCPEMIAIREFLLSYGRKYEIIKTG